MAVIGSICKSTMRQHAVKVSEIHLGQSLHLSQAFSWWPELMAEHAETFLSLYQAEMDAALQVQPVDSWNSFPLFQLHNNFLQTDCECS